MLQGRGKEEATRLSTLHRAWRHKSNCCVLRRGTSSFDEMSRAACVALLVAVLCTVAAVAQHAHYVDGKHNPLYEHQAGEEHAHPTADADEVVVRARIESCSG